MTKKNNPKLSVINFIQRSAEDKNLPQLLQQILGIGDRNISNEKELDRHEMEVIKGEKDTNTTDKRSNHKIAVIKFMQQSADNEIMQKKLEKILGVGDGDISNENKLDQDEAEALKGKQGVKFIEFAHEQGFDFSLQDLIDVVEAFENYREGKISDLELFQILELSADNIHLIPSLKVQEVSYRGQHYLKIDGVSIPIYTTKERTKNNLKTDEDTFFG